MTNALYSFLAGSRAVLVCFTLLSLFGCGSGEDLHDVATSDPAPAETGPTLDEATQKIRAQDLDGAAVLLTQITEREPDNGRAWYLLGFTRHRQEQLDEALIAFARAAEVDPEQRAALFGAARIHAARDEAERAFELLQQLEVSGKFDLSQIDLVDEFAPLREDARYQELRMQPEDFVDPFVEDTRILHEWVGEAAGDEFGWIARNIGDVDGDGIADVATSAPSKNLDGEQAGRIYVYSGKNGELLWSHSGEPGDRLGLGIETAGDVDADGVPDVVASSPGGDKVEVFAGRDGKVLLTLTAAQSEEMFGRDVVGVGDVNDDGHGDLLVGSPRNDAAGEEAGRTAVYSGKDGSLLHEWSGEAGDRMGAAVAGRVDDDHFFLLSGAPDAGDGDRGRVYVYTALTDEPAFIIESDEQGAELGAMFLSVIGDIDVDGVPDLYASDWSHNGKGPSSGLIVVHSGKDGRLLLELSGEAAGDGFGIGPADAGDVDGDGYADLIVGAWQQASAAPAGGKVYLYSGKDGSLMRAWTCRVMGDTFGFDATGMGDVDGDGHIDFLLTSAWSAVNGPKSGRVFILAGG